MLAAVGCGTRVPRSRARWPGSLPGDAEDLFTRLLKPALRDRENLILSILVIDIFDNRDPGARRRTARRGPRSHGFEEVAIGSNGPGGHAAVTFRQLRFLVAVANELNFSRAAQRCHVTQPTLSAGLQELEERLGVRLVERSRRSVMMTAIGTEIAERGRALLTGAQEIEALAAAHLNPEETTLRLGAIPTVGPYLLPRALPKLRETFPKLRLFLREEITETLLEGVADGRLDFALIALPFDIGSLPWMPLFDDGFHLATPPETSPETVFRNGQLLLLEQGHCLQTHALRAYPDWQMQQDTSFEATSLTTLTSMVSEGLGSTLLPDLAVAAGVAAGQRVSLTPLPNAVPRQVGLVWRRTSPHVQAFERLGEVLKAAHAALS